MARQLTPSYRHDVVVVGARCAGAATAMLLAAAGHDVALVDRSVSPSDTLSTHAIARSGVVQLNRWRLLQPVLDALLVDAAVSAGVRLMTGVTVDGVRRRFDGRVTGVRGRSDGREVEIAAQFVVGADGRDSRIARSVNAPFTEVRGAGDALSARRSHDTIEGAFDALLCSTVPALSEQFHNDAIRRSITRRIIGLPNHLRHPVGPGWALVGDAGYHRDAITGHGISDAFRDAELLADALDLSLRDESHEAVALAGYHAARDEQFREVFEITCELATYPPVDRFIELQRQLGGRSGQAVAQTRSSAP